MFRRVVLSIAVLAGAVTAATISPPTAHGLDAATFADQVFAEVNQYRTSAGLRPLTRSATLDAGAREWSHHMMNGGCPGSDFICHRSRDGIAALARAAAAPNKASWWAENVQYARGGNFSPQSMTRSLMNSPGHRANIMRADTNLVGIGVVIASNGGVYVTHNFGQAAQSAQPSPPPTSHPCGRVSSTFSYGSKGTKVKVLQCALTKAGVYSGPISGKFAKLTRAAVKAFQASRGLKQTGSANLVTRRALGISR